MRIQARTPDDLTENDVTPEAVYLNRRLFLKGLGVGGALVAGSAHAGLLDLLSGGKPKVAPRQPLKYQPDRSKVDDALTKTPEYKVTSHNNFYEFGTSKTDPEENSGHFTVKPWTLSVEGEVAKPATVDVWDLINTASLDERIYRMRCVEAWSMVIPWVGIGLGTFLKRFEPTSRAKYVAFQSVYDPKEMPGQRSPIVGGGINFPYVEGLRIDEAMHPLTLLTVGLYGKVLPPQNGAPIRLVVPWKYGFKGIKSIVKIKLVEKMPPTTWNLMAPDEYGFYANVNPHVDHPRWSQATERFIGPGSFLSVTRQPTLMFNGYADQVASLYKGMDLRRYF